MYRLIEDDNSIYEIDEVCEKRKREQNDPKHQETATQEKQIPNKNPRQKKSRP